MPRSRFDAPFRIPVLAGPRRVRYEEAMKRLLALLVLLGLPLAATAADRPNLIVFLADDLGYGDLGCYGHPLIQTPNLDAFAKEGVRLTQCYSASAVCSPSRSAILTGRTPHRNGVYTWIAEGGEVHLRTSEITLPNTPPRFGLHHLPQRQMAPQRILQRPPSAQPVDHGYDWWFATQNNAGPHPRESDELRPQRHARGGFVRILRPLLVGEAVTWLKEKRDPGKPFFLAVWTHEPHYPIKSDPKFKALYPGLSDDVQVEHHANVTQMDNAFGELMKALDANGLRENTIVFFTSDNGPEGDGVKSPGRGSQGGLRGRKRDLHEGGIRVPGLARWPGHIPAVSVSDTPVYRQRPVPHLSRRGRSEGSRRPRPRRRRTSPRPSPARPPLERPQPLYWRLHMAPNAQYAMRVGDWKLLADATLTQYELYDLRTDPTESNDLAKQETARFTAMKNSSSPTTPRWRPRAPTGGNASARAEERRRKP